MAAMSGGAHTIDDMVSRIYPDLAPALHGHAGRNVLAHLLKLEHEGRARRFGEAAWHIIEP
jgi:hypothetical protein